MINKTLICHNRLRIQNFARFAEFLQMKIDFLPFQKLSYSGIVKTKLSFNRLRRYNYARLLNSSI